MTYPPGVQLATLTFSNPSTFLGNEATRTETTVQSTAGVVWSATGQPIDDFEEVVSPGAGMPGSLTVPFVDQPGFTDQAGNVFNNWAYIVTRKTIFGNKVKTVRKNWQPIIGQDNTDFDNLPGGTIGLPVSVPAVAVTSVAGLTSTVGAADLAVALDPFMPAPDVSGKLDITALDAATAADITTPGTETATVLDATYAQPNKNTIVLLGDSITAANEPGPLNSTWNTEANLYQDSFGYWTWASIALGGRMKMLRNSGISGNTTAQILARVDSEVIAHNPGWCMVMGGRNDFDVLNAAASVTKTNLQAIVEKLLGAGIKVVLGTVLPATTDNDAAKKARIQDVNRWIVNYASTTRGVTLCDWHAAWADPATADPVAGLTLDGIHPTRDGASRLGSVLFEALKNGVTGTRTLVTSNVDETSLGLNPMMIGTAGTLGTGVTGVVADGWKVDFPFTAATAVASKVAHTDGVQGFWQQVQITSLQTVRLSHSSYTASKVAGKWAGGDGFYVEAEFEADADWAGALKFGLQSYVAGQAHNAYALADFAGGALSTGLVYPRSGVLRSPVVKFAAGATNVGVGFDFKSAAGTVRIGRMAIRKAV